MELGAAPETETLEENGILEQGFLTEGSQVIRGLWPQYSDSRVRKRLAAPWHPARVHAHGREAVLLRLAAEAVYVGRRRVRLQVRVPRVKEGLELSL